MAQKKVERDEDLSDESSVGADEVSDANDNEGSDGEGEGEEIVESTAQEVLEENEETSSSPSNPTSKEESAKGPPPFPSDGKYRNKQRCLMICSRGVKSRFRHFLEDLRTLVPHHKKEAKLDVSKNAAGGIGAAVQEISEMKSCNTVLFLECRKRQDCYLWLGRTGQGGGGYGKIGGGHSTPVGSSAPVGPTAKFLVENIHTMDELRLTGNCMKGSRPLLSFDKSFEELDELKLLKCLFVDVFGTPRGHPKSKPFVDRVMGFYYADNKIWVRNYQIQEHDASNAKEAHSEKKKHGTTSSTSLVEIGPRFVLNPIRIFRGSFGGQTLYQNTEFVSPNTARSMEYKRKSVGYEQRKDAQKKRKVRKEQQDENMPVDPLQGVFR